MASAGKRLNGKHFFQKDRVKDEQKKTSYLLLASLLLIAALYESSHQLCQAHLNVLVIPARQPSSSTTTWLTRSRSAFWRDRPLRRKMSAAPRMHSMQRKLVLLVQLTADVPCTSVVCLEWAGKLMSVFRWVPAEKSILKCMDNCQNTSNAFRTSKINCSWIKSMRTIIF